MYVYRTLTPEERVQIVENRRARGYPLHAPPHPFRLAGHYLITAPNYEHTHVMADAVRRTEFEALLLDAMQAIHADVCGWVILPNHYHILVGVESLDLISAALKQLHGATSREWNLQDGLTGKRRVWYKFADRMIRDERHFCTCLNYIHFNPVKHGYVQDPQDWIWTSLANYFQHNGRDWLRETYKKYPPGHFGKDWDDM